MFHRGEGLYAMLCELLEIDKTRTIPYYPNSGSLVERLNKINGNRYTTRNETTSASQLFIYLMNR